MTFVFALILIFIIRYNPQCITSNIFDETKLFSALLNDTWQLSWTTFFTVGYGVISPSTQSVFDKNSALQNGSCIALSFVLSCESLIGILYNSFAGAIIFGKLLQFQSNAQIRFSNIMVVSYGNTIDDDINDDDDDVFSDNDEDASNLKLSEKMECPVLRFRIVNLLKSRNKGHIVNSSVQAIALIDVKNAARNARVTHDIQYQNAFQSKRQLPATSTKHFASSLYRFVRAPSMYKAHLEANKDSFDIVPPPQAQVEAPSMVFMKIALDPASHPCFSTTPWRPAHTLNADSPLLSKAMRKIIKNNDGYWPAHLCTKDNIMANISFRQLLVSFKGLSKSTGTEVYLSHLYEFESLKVGCAFRSILLNVDGYIGVDPDGIDNYDEQ